MAWLADGKTLEAWFLRHAIEYHTEAARGIYVAMERVKEMVKESRLEGEMDGLEARLRVITTVGDCHFHDLSQHTD